MTRPCDARPKWQWTRNRSVSGCAAKMAVVVRGAIRAHARTRDSKGPRPRRSGCVLGQVPTDGSGYGQANARDHARGPGLRGPEALHAVVPQDLRPAGARLLLPHRVAVPDQPTGGALHAA